MGAEFSRFPTLLKTPKLKFIEKPTPGVKTGAFIFFPPLTRPCHFPPARRRALGAVRYCGMGITMARETVPRAAEGETSPKNAVPSPLRVAKIVKLAPAAV